MSFFLAWKYCCKSIFKPKEIAGVTTIICFTANSFCMINFCNKAILPPSNTPISVAIIKYFMYICFLLPFGVKIHTLSIPDKIAPITNLIHKTKGRTKQILLITAPRNAANTIFFCVTEQRKNKLASSHVQSIKTKFNRKIYSI